MSSNTPSPDPISRPPSANCNMTPPGFGWEFEIALEKAFLKHSQRLTARLHKYRQFGMDEHNAREPTPEDMREKYAQFLDDLLAPTPPSEYSVYSTPRSKTPRSKTPRSKTPRSKTPRSKTPPPDSNLRAHLPIPILPEFEVLAYGDEIESQMEVDEARLNALRSRAELDNFISMLNDPGHYDSLQFWQEMEGFYKDCYMKLIDLLSWPKDPADDEEISNAPPHTLPESQTSDTHDTRFEKLSAPSKRARKSQRGKSNGLDAKAVIPNKSQKVTKRRPKTRSTKGRLVKGLK